MHLRKTRTAKNRIYLAIVDSFYDKERKMSRSKTIASLGYLDELEKLYDDPIAHFQKYVNQLKAEKRKNRLLFTSHSMIRTIYALPIPHFVKISVMQHSVRYTMNSRLINSSLIASVIPMKNMMPIP